MIKMENIGEQDFGDFVPESLFEAIDQLNNGGKSCPNTTSYVHFLDEFMDYELDLSSENCTMTSFLELEQEIKEAPVISEPLIRPSVIVRASASAKPTVQPTLTDIMQTCGIEYDLPKEYNVSSPGRSTRGPNLPRHPQPRPTQPTGRRGRRPRTGRPPSGTGRRRRLSRSWQRRSWRPLRTRTSA